jgi:transcriptional regulator with XRE-family HTH domain
MNHLKNSSTSKKLAKFIKSDRFRKKSHQYKRMIALGEKIYGRRKDLGLTQGELASSANTTQRIISELESGTYAPHNGIGEELYDKLSIALKIDRDYLFSEKIDRQTFELFAYLGKKLNWKWDIMQFMKLPYFGFFVKN